MEMRAAQAARELVERAAVEREVAERAEACHAAIPALVSDLEDGLTAGAVVAAVEVLVAELQIPGPMVNSWR